MKIAKLLVPIILLAAVYFIFFSTNLPSEIRFQGHTLGPREKVKNDSAREFDIYSYRDRSNHHVLLFVMATDGDTTSQQLLDFYASVFEAQGFAFRKKDARHLGRKGDEVIYLTRAPMIDSAVAYIEKAPASYPAGFRSAGKVFEALEGFSF
jgi:hypothetical protein